MRRLHASRVFSFLALREVGDYVVGQIAGGNPISIHALREEGDAPGEIRNRS